MRLCVVGDENEKSAGKEEGWQDQRDVSIVSGSLQRPSQYDQVNYDNHRRYAGQVRGALIRSIALLGDIQEPDILLQEQEPYP